MSEITGDDRMLLNALADGELDASTALTLERRLAVEPGLKAAYDAILAVKQRVTALERPELTAEFMGRIAALAPAASNVTPITRAKRSFYNGWQAIAAAVVITAFVASSGTYVLTTSSQSGISVEDQIADAHRRSLLATSPVDIVTSDRHTVKPWLDAKLGVSPPTADWGLMLSTLRQSIYVQPLVCALPGVAILITSIAFNLVSDGLRQAMDVKA